MAEEDEINQPEAPEGPNAIVDGEDIALETEARKLGNESLVRHAVSPITREECRNIRAA